MADGPRGYAIRIDIQADGRRVWRGFNESPHLARWCSDGAATSARAGGSFRAALDRHREMLAHIDIFEPPRRIRLIHLPAAGAESSDSARVDDILFEARTTETIVRVLGSGFLANPHDDALLRQYRAGWRLALARMKVYLEKHLDEVKTP